MSFWKKFIPKKPIETADPTPVEMPVTFHRPPTLQEQIRQYTQNTLNKMAEQSGHETFEEANDFDIGEIEPASPHEIEFGAEGEARFERELYEHVTRNKKYAESKAKPPVSGAGTPAPDAGGQTTSVKEA